MSDEILMDIRERLDHLVLLTARNTVKGLKPNEAIIMLAEVGLDRNVIARLVGTTPLTVSVRLSEAKARNPRTRKSGVGQRNG